VRNLWIKRLALWEWYCFLFFIYSLAMVESPKNILWGLLLASYLFRVYIGEETISLKKLEVSVLIWILVGIVSIFFAIEPAEGAKGVWDMIRAGSVLWIGTSLLKNEDNRLLFLRHLVIATTIAALWGFKDYFWGRFILNKHTIRVQLPSVGHFNQSGIYLAMVWLAGFATLLDARVFPKKWIGQLSVLILSAALLGTTARTAIAVSILISVFMLFFLRLSKKLLSIWIACFAVGLLVMITTPGFIGRVLFRGSFSSRVQIWESAFDETLLRPLTGVGLNNFKNVYLSHTTDPVVFAIDHAHNIFMNTLVQTGWIGLLALGFLTVSSFHVIWKARKENRTSTFFPALGAWGIIFIVGLSHTTLHHENAILFFLFMSFCNSSPREKLNPEISKTSDC
jgi:O-antigen ligase